LSVEKLAPSHPFARLLLTKNQGIKPMPDSFFHSHHASASLLEIGRAYPRFQSARRHSFRQRIGP
jgi:hypothetical protein